MLLVCRVVLNSCELKAILEKKEPPLSLGKVLIKVEGEPVRLERL